MNGGDTFFIQQVGKLYDSHLWMVLSDPGLDANQVLIVSLTTWGKDDDPACVLNVGDHPFVRQKSFVKYSHGKVVTDQQLEEFRSRGQIHVQAGQTKGSGLFVSDWHALITGKVVVARRRLRPIFRQGREREREKVERKDRHFN